MIINSQQLIALLPLLIIGLTVIVLILCIAWRRNLFINAILTAIGLNLALFSLWFVVQNGPIDVTPLIRIDRFSMFYIGLVLIASLAISAMAYTWLKGYSGDRDEFYLLILVAVMGSILLISANHLAAMFLGIEMISLPLFGLVGYTFFQKYSLEASIKYTLLSAMASSFLLFGMALIYAKTGQLSFSSIGKILNDIVLTQKMLLAGLGMILVGLGFKLSLVPFHLWTPDVYQGSPTPASALLATIGKIAIFLVLVRLFLYVPMIHSYVVRLVLENIASSSILFGNLIALNQSNIKRILGYSSIAQMGYLLVGLIGDQSLTLMLETVGIYLTGYLFATLGTFSVINLISSSYTGKNVDSLYSYRGLFWRKPLLSFILTIMILSLAGIPMTFGFIGKFYIITLGLNSHLGYLVGIVIIGSVIGLFYYLRIIINLYLSPPKNLQYDTSFCGVTTVSELVALVLSSLVLLLGLYPQPIITLVQLARPIF